MKEIVEFVDEVAGLYFRSLLLPEIGLNVPQHIHPYDHATYCGNGSAAIYVDGKRTGTLQAGHAILVQAGKKHWFESLEPNTRLTCVHDTRSAEFIKKSGI